MEQIEDPDRLKMDFLKLKGHASLWWDYVHVDTTRKGNDNIKTWDRMVAKIKAKFLPNVYMFNLY